MATPIIELSDGKLQGTIKKNYKDEDFYAFLGIPFAKPPVGDLRFKVSVNNKYRLESILSVNKNIN